jgi:diguanylate cyclase (GGDEF)-like protein
VIIDEIDSAESRRVRAAGNAVLALLIFALCLLIAVRFIESRQQADAELQRFLALQELATVRARIEGHLNANLVAIRTLRAEISLNPVVEPERFRRLADEALTDELHTRHVALAPDLVIRFVYPLAGNEAAVGLDYRDSPIQLASIEAALKASDILISGPVDLVQGGRALIARVPVYEYRSNELWGVISQVIDHERLFADSGLFDSESWSIGLRGVDGAGMDGEVIAGPDGIWQHNPVMVPIDLPVGQWQLAAMPVSLSWERSLVSYAGFWFLGGALALVASLLIYGLLSSRMRLQHALSTISHQARFDGLSGLPNRQFFTQHLEAHIGRCRRHDERFALMFLDLDHFKEINDSLGHEAGDDLLQACSERIAGAVRADDMVARFGGDEFVILVSDLSDPVAAEQAAERLFDTLQAPFAVAGHELSIGGSIGIAVYPDDGRSTSDLLKHADLAMYAAKSAGRGTSYFYNESLRHQSETHLKLHREIQLGLADGQFEVYYQPMVDAASGEIRAVEALIRWNHPEQGLLSPADFIPVAERTGVIRELGEQVLQQGCADCQRMLRAGLDVTLSVNRSPREFNDRKMVQRWLETLDQEGLPAQRLTVELTESLLMPDQERQHQLLRALHEGGVRLSIDDFGTGYSSVTYLRNFPVSQIKIDGAFVANMLEDDSQYALVEALVKMAQALGLEVVAEGVETVEQAQTLAAMGCHLLQGYYFDRPMPVSELIDRYGAAPPAG